LQEFLCEEAARIENEQNAVTLAAVEQADERKRLAKQLVFPSELWNLSQFWYSDQTRVTLAEECARLANGGIIACLACPSTYHALITDVGYDPALAYCFEYDHRFSIYGTSFIHYDYKSPLEFPAELRKQCAVVIIDPPYLQEDVLISTSVSMVALRAEQGHMIIATGLTMDGVITERLKMHRARFEPQHSNGLSNPFGTWTSFTSEEQPNSLLWKEGKSM